MRPDWNAAEWQQAEIAGITHFHPESSRHRPETKARICYHQKGINLLFTVLDRYVRCRHTAYNAKVNEDSCVEWFIQPPGSKGYYNIEMNCIGTLHVNFILDPERDEHGKRKDVRKIPPAHARQIRIRSSLTADTVPEESNGEVRWCLAAHIPFSFFSLYSPLQVIDNTVWKGNLYKCGDKTAYPHWAAWNPVRTLNFHQPACFGTFVFSPRRL